MLFTIDGSETSWLVYADWLEDQGLDATHIREPVEVNWWYYHTPVGNRVGDWNHQREYYLYNEVGAKTRFDSDNEVGSDLPHRGVGVTIGGWVGVTQY
jgi:hypothetical protein